jgi:hypothetical protein
MNSTRPTTPAPSPISARPEVARFLAAQAAVNVALREQAKAIQALRELDSTFPMTVAL